MQIYYGIAISMLPHLIASIDLVRLLIMRVELILFAIHFILILILYRVEF